MSRKSILVVDDEKSQREILEMILSGEFILHLILVPQPF